MTPCHACKLLTPRRLCRFCERTLELIRSRRCVSCTGRINVPDSLRVEGKCAECLVAGNRMSAGTRWLLRQTSRVRYELARSAA